MYVSKFQMVSVTSILQPLKVICLFIVIDLKDACFHMSVHSQHHFFKCFYCGGSIFQYTVLPFSLAMALRVFLKCLAPVVSYLHL